MDSLDTNILARYYLADDPKQTPSALALLEGNRPLQVPVSVVLELCWLLESRYGLARERITLVLRHLLALPCIHIENEPAVVVAVNAYAKGLDIADALHLACSSKSDRLLTFDKKFAVRANRLKLTPRCEVPELQRS